MWVRMEQKNSMHHGIGKNINGMEGKKINDFPPNNETILNVTVPSIP